MINWPKISIVTPSYNQGKYLEKTILSVLKQEYPNLEYIIIDGGSTDNSVEIIKKYQKHLAYWVSEPDRGQSHAINKGFERATGELLAWLNSDDYYAPNALNAIVEGYLANPTAGAVVGAGEMVDLEGKQLIEVRRKQITLESLYDWFDQFFWQPSCFFRRDVWHNCGPLDEDVHYAMDLDLWIKVAQKYEFMTIDEKISFNLRHPKAKTTEFLYLSQVDAIMVVLRHGGATKARALLEKYAGRLHKTAEEGHALVLEHWETIQKLNLELHSKNIELDNIKKSVLWRITKPLRIVRRLLHHDS